jgi:hypothetical protein
MRPKLRRTKLSKGQPLGLDELMIVNPSPSGLGAIFLGTDGMLYQVQGLDREEEVRGLGQFFLGEDGTLYQAQSPGLSGLAHRGLGRFFLGEDGVLYEVVR